jgi:hypothetical protein
MKNFPLQQQNPALHYCCLGLRSLAVDLLEPILLAPLQPQELAVVLLQTGPVSDADDGEDVPPLVMRVPLQYGLWSRAMLVELAIERERRREGGGREREGREEKRGETSGDLAEVKFTLSSKPLL